MYRCDLISLHQIPVPRMFCYHFLTLDFAPSPLPSDRCPLVISTNLEISAYPSHFSYLFTPCVLSFFPPCSSPWASRLAPHPPHILRHAPPEPPSFGPLGALGDRQTSFSPTSCSAHHHHPRFLSAIHHAQHLRLGRRYRVGSLGAHPSSLVRFFLRPSRGNTRRDRKSQRLVVPITGQLPPQPRHHCEILLPHRGETPPATASASHVPGDERARRTRLGTSGTRSRKG